MNTNIINYEEWLEFNKKTCYDVSNAKEKNLNPLVWIGKYFETVKTLQNDFAGFTNNDYVVLNDEKLNVSEITFNNCPAYNINSFIELLKTQTHKNYVYLHSMKYIYNPNTFDTCLYLFAVVKTKELEN